jgi:hypoxanthine phosphoribosyltransferase
MGKFMQLPQAILEVYAKATQLYAKEDIELALDKMAEEINEQLADSNPILLCVVIGGIVPMGNLLPRLPFPLETDYIHATRYQHETTGSEIEWRATPATSLKNRVIIVVDDILDEGITLAAVANYCHEQGAKKVYTAVLVDKNRPRKDGGIKEADFVGLTIDDVFVFGYGLDYKGYLRNAPGIYAVADEHK